jgi:hypothetical protein
MLCLCIKCGTRKRGHLHRCRTCGFKPSSTADVAKSLYLSRGVYTDEERADSPHFVPEDYSEERLVQIGSELAAGVPYKYNEARLAKLVAQGEAVKSVNGRVLFWWFVRFLGPPIALLGGLWGVVWLLKGLR